MTCDAVHPSWAQLRCTEDRGHRRAHTCAEAGVRVSWPRTLGQETPLPLVDAWGSPTQALPGVFVPRPRAGYAPPPGVASSLRRAGRERVPQPV